jgi:phage baseplate assembly protein W
LIFWGLNNRTFFGTGMQRRYFTGFSTTDTETTGRWRFYDTELIIKDLTNHFHTRRGSRHMRPRWGCRIWDWLFDPMTPTLRDEIVREIVRVVESDPRVAIENPSTDIQLLEFSNGIRVQIKAVDRSRDAVLNFAVEFDRRERERTQGTLD